MNQSSSRLGKVVGFWIEAVPRTLMCGLADHRRNCAHTHRQALPIWPTRGQAQKAAKALDNEWWTHRVRMAREANIVNNTKEH